MATIIDGCQRLMWMVQLFCIFVWFVVATCLTKFVKNNARYYRLRDEFVRKGFDLRYIQHQRKWFVEDVNGYMTPITYSAIPYALKATRVLVIPVKDSMLCELLTCAVHDVIRLLPEGTQVATNDPQELHVTVWHLSHINDPRSNPFHPTGRSSEGNPSESVLEREIECASRIAAQSPPFALQAHGLIMTRSGTLILYWKDCQHLQSMRHHCRGKFPGSPTKQPGIIHTSLMRVLTPVQLNSANQKNVGLYLSRIGSQIHGRILLVEHVVHCIEYAYSTTKNAQKTVMELGSA